MNKPIVTIILLFSLVWGCSTEKQVNSKQEYLRWVGDIEHNDKIDGLNFTVCNGDDNILQYFNPGQGPVYRGEKSAIYDRFKSNYKSVPGHTEDGFIRIRFIVNCEGKAGRFRILQSSYAYKEKEFDKAIISQLLDITKGIEGWEIIYNENKPVDYYMYLIFKVNDGQLTEILP